MPSGSGIGDRFQEFEPVPVQVVNVEAAVTGEIVVPVDVATHLLYPCGERVEISDKDSWMRLGRCSKSVSTPRCSSSRPERNQQPPRAASTGGFSISDMPRMSA